MSFRSTGALILILMLVTPALFTNYNIKPIIPEAGALEPVTTRYDCYEDTDYQNGTHTQVLGLPCWVQGSPFTKWILTSYTDRIEMKNGMYGGQLNTTDSSLRYYDLYYHDLKGTESWVVEYFDGSEWVDTDIKSTVPTISTIQNDTGIFVKSTRNNNEIVLTIDYITLEGLPLKHRIELKNLGSEREFRIMQEHEIIDGDDVIHSGNLVSISSTLQTEDGSIKFMHSNGTLILHEEQSSDYYRNATISPANGNLDSSFLFGNIGNRTGMRLPQNGTFTMATGATCTKTGGDTDCDIARHGDFISATSGTAGQPCPSSSWGQEAGANQAGKTDNERCYVRYLVYSTSNIGSGATVTDVTMTFNDDIRCQVGSENCGVNLDIHYVNDDSCASFDDALANNLLDAPLTAITNQDPDDWESATVDLGTDVDSYVNTQLTGTYSGGVQDEICFSFSQTGSDVTGSAGGLDYWKIDSPIIIITYSTTITMSFDINDNAGTLLQKGNILLRATEGTNAGVAAATYTACANECTFSATPSTTYTFAVQWNAAGTSAGKLLNYVKVDIGSTTFNSTHTHSCASNCDVEFNTQIYQNIDVEFRDTNGELHSPAGVTVVHTENSTELTRTDFASKGVMNWPLLGVGNTTSFRIKDVSLYGNNVVTNASATITPTTIDDNIQHNNRVYFIDITALSVDKAIYITPSRVDFKHSCSTVCTNTTQVAITDMTGIQITNMTVDLMSMRYQGWSLNQNSSDFSIGIMGTHAAPTVNKTLLLTANYFKMFYQAQADSTNLPVSVNLKSILANGTTIDVATTTAGINELPIFMGNSSQTLNIIWNSLNVSKTTQAPSASATVNVATQLKFPTGNEFVVGRNNTELSEFAWHDGNSTFRVNATVNLADKDADQTLKIEIVDRQYAAEPLKRTLNTTLVESGWSFSDPIISDVFSISGEGNLATFIKYVLDDGASAGGGAAPGAGGGNGGGGGASISRPADVVVAGLLEGVDAVLPGEQYGRSEYILIATVFLGIGVITLGNGFGVAGKRKGQGKKTHGSNSKRGGKTKA